MEKTQACLLNHLILYLLLMWYVIFSPYFLYALRTVFEAVQDMLLHMAVYVYTIV